MSDIDKPLPNDAPNVTLTIRMIMSGKEVGSIIGKGGEIINSIREESGAKIHISDGSVPERIVTVTGSVDAIDKAFGMICRKFEEDGPVSDGKSSSASSTRSTPVGPVSLKLVVPASQCGSLIGKGGSKIKEIREATGASVQVASEMLPASTERAVTIGGTTKNITDCLYQICCVMLESPPKGTTIPYSPKAGMGSGVLGGGGRGNSNNSRGGPVPDNPLASLLNLGSTGSALAAIASLAGSQIRDRRSSDREGGERGGGASQSYEIFVPNDMIGCIIGKGGSKIAEIRQISGAMIRISKSDDNDRGSNDGSGGGGNPSERQITITGNPDSVALAKSLINMSLDLHKSKLETGGGAGGSGGGGGGGGSSDGGSSRDSRDSRGDRGDRPQRDHHRGGGGGGGGAGGSGGGANFNAGLGLAQLLAKPEALTALTTLASLSNLGNLGGGLLAGLSGGAGSSSGSGHVTGVHRRGGGSSRSRDDDRGSRDSKRSKFAPY